MKRQYNFLSVILAAGLLTACNSDEPQGNNLPAGQYPLQVSASVGAPQSRSVGKDSWTGDGSEAFGVRIDADGRVANYVITDANGKAEAASGSIPLYWDNTNEVAVSAWLPYEPQTDVDISDQSAGFAQFDYLAAIAEGQSYLAPVSLQFTHKMAKVRCVLKSGKGVTEADLNAASVKFAGYTSATFTEGNLTGTGYGWITPASDREALLVPQNMTGKDFITIEMGGNEYVYAPVDDNAGLLKDGLLHQYTITVKADGIEVTAVTGGEWNYDGSEDVASKEVMQTYSASDLKLGDYYYADGTWSDGGLRKLYADGSTTQEAVQPNGKTVIGVVFYAGHHPNDQSDYSSTGINSEKCHGYVVALNDATADFCMWGPFDKELDCCPTDAGGTKLNNYTNPEIDWSGYEWSYKIISAAGGIGKLNETTESGYPATYYAVVAYETGCKAPVNSSGWFLPSIGQLWSIYQLRSSLFDGKDMLITPKDDTYWCSSESHDSNAAICAFVVGWFSGYVAFHIKNDEGCYVRPILAF